MKFLFTILFSSITFLLNAQQAQNFNLKIIVDNSLASPNQVKLTLNYFDKSEPINHLLKIENKSISFKAASKEPALALLSLSWADKKRMNISFLLPVDTGSIFISADYKVDITFKNQNQLFKDYALMESEISKFRQLSSTKTKAINFENKSTTGVQKEIDSIAQHFDRIIDYNVYKRTIDEQKNSFLGIIALIKYAERPYSHQRRKFEGDSLLVLANTFSSAMKNLPAMKSFHQLLISEKKLDLGTLLPSFKVHDTLNQEQELKKFYGNKYTLVDIWASWCVPCREEHPNLLKQYQKYKQKGLEIISISTDKPSDSHLWKAAIANDKIAVWPHFIDTDQTTKRLLNIRFIPANFLIDHQGNIIAKYLRGEELNAKLAELFKN